MEPHSSICAWRIPWGEEPGGVQSTLWCVQRVRHTRVTEHAHPGKWLLIRSQLGNAQSWHKQEFLLDSSLHYHTILIAKWMGREKVTRLSWPFCNPMDCSPPVSSGHGIFQASILEWGAISYSRGFSNPRIKPGSPVSPILAGRFFTTCTTWEAHQIIKRQRFIPSQRCKDTFLSHFSQSCSVCLCPLVISYSINIDSVK